MRIKCCRLCGNPNIKTIINLGDQKYTGVFPRKGQEDISGGVLELVKCCGDGGCGLVQLAESFDPQSMYGDNYGYHSSLNISMVSHLTDIADEVLNEVLLKDGELILDIGSNDGTLLSTFQQRVADSVSLVGIDPSGKKFKEYYKEGIQLIEDFFSASVFKSRLGENRKAKIITSIAMFYDLEDPIAFAKDVESILDDNGIWVVEQSYLPLMVVTSSYDTICHEHIEFYALKQLVYIAEKSDLRVINVSTNDTNGGSFRVTMCKKDSPRKTSEQVKMLLQEELDNGVNEISYFDGFKENIAIHRKDLMDFLRKCRDENKMVLGYGASTKGNVVLQYCDIDSTLIQAIVEVNSDKYGCVTPGTNIPIISEEEGRKMNPDYFVVLPWHFKSNILQKERDFISSTGTKFVFYLPYFHIVG